MSHPNGGSPDSLHGDGDEAGDGVCQGQVKHQEVDVGAASENLKRSPKCLKLISSILFYTENLFK